MNGRPEQIDETDPGFLAEVEAEVYRMRVREFAARLYRERYGSSALTTTGLPPVPGAGSVLARPQQAALHEYLRERGPSYVGAIAEDLGRTRTAIRQSVARLVRSGYAAPCPPPPGSPPEAARAKWFEAVGHFPDEEIADPLVADCETAHAIRELCVANGATFASEVARHMGVTSSTMAGRLERLYDRGILTDAPAGGRAPGSPAPAGARLLCFARPAAEACS